MHPTCWGQQCWKHLRGPIYLHDTYNPQTGVGQLSSPPLLPSPPLASPFSSRNPQPFCAKLGTDYASQSSPSLPAIHCWLPYIKDITTLQNRSWTVPWVDQLGQTHKPTDNTEVVLLVCYHPCDKHVLAIVNDFSQTLVLCCGSPYTIMCFINYWGDLFDAIFEFWLTLCPWIFMHNNFKTCKIVYDPHPQGCKNCLRNHKCKLSWNVALILYCYM